jgi:hypothetical protein
MMRLKQDESSPKNPQMVPTTGPQSNENFPGACGPGCACGGKTETGKWKIVVMLIVMAVIVILSIYKEIL